MMIQEALANKFHANIFIGVFSFIGIAGFWNGIPSLFRYRPALEYRPVTDFYGIPAEGYMVHISAQTQVCKSGLLM